jgi:adenylate kinase family enzyme
MLPSLEWILGPTKSGKKTLAQTISNRICAPTIHFKNWLHEQGLTHSDDDKKVHALIAVLARLREPRMILVDFPQNSYQAKLFVKNAVAPSNIFLLECNIDTCQERML